ncbi:MAG: hypothetical protein NZ750_05185 [Anaerolineae bacterium]|nr:hypothetical protein [Anaerolineae bacterium]MDW8172681.1 hypothetical protein [Anaerolineae bacterium]
MLTQLRYLEGSTDLSILQALAKQLKHPAAQALQSPFVHYVANDPQKAIRHFQALREAFPDLLGLAVFDQYGRSLPDERGGIDMLMWGRRELENYITTPEVLRRYAVSGLNDDLFGLAQRQQRLEVMERVLSDQVPPVALRDPQNSYWVRTKISDQLLDPLFEAYFAALGLPNTFPKSDHHLLAGHLLPDEIAPEVVQALDRIAKTAAQAQLSVLPTADEDHEDDGEDAP